MPGVLAGVTIIELAGIGPAPFCGMMLADHGARVIRVDRLGAADAAGRDVLSRNRERIEVDLKTSELSQQSRHIRLDTALRPWCHHVMFTTFFRLIAFVAFVAGGLRAAEPAAAQKP